jgi:S-adenosylmethionine synthetase
MSEPRTRTAESVAPGHPDKLADRIADEVLDAALRLDPLARVAVEVALSHRSITLFGELSARETPDYEAAIGRALLATGWASGRWETGIAERRIEIAGQSAEIARGIEHSLASDPYESLGAGDQGTVIGYATDEHPSLLPAPLVFARALMRAQHERLLDARSPLGPDAKAQVTVAYRPDGAVDSIATVLISSLHRARLGHDELVAEIDDHLLTRLPADLVRPETRILVNPAGAWTVGGPAADSGLTGRKLAVDSYGGIGRHGGGAWSGKDPSKIDRSGAYAARQAAVSLVRAGLAHEVEVAVSYAIGVSRPVAIAVDSFGSGAMSDERLAALIADRIDFRPAAIIERLDLRTPSYAPLASFGHFGRGDLPWESPVAI